MQRIPFAILAAAILAWSPASTVAATGNGYTPQASRAYVRESVLAERDFPFLSALLHDPELDSTLAKDHNLARITANRWKVGAQANLQCGNNLPCKCGSEQFTPIEAAQISAELRHIFASNVNLQRFVQQRLNGNPEFSRDSLLGADLFVDNWERSVTALNRIISTYCAGSPPRYGEIDSMAYQANSHTYTSLIRIILDDLPIEEDKSLREQGKSETLFFEPELRFALRLLQANSRNEAGRLWPLAAGENKPAMNHIQSIQWTQYQYSVIVVPGAGSEFAGISLSPWAKERLRLAVHAYHAGLAPLLLVSGGFVHPPQTRFCEALEMKRYLMEIYDIPASDILVDSYARHTTTNLRNASRLVLKSHLPINKQMLIVSDANQTNYIASETFHKRNKDELGYQPVILGKRLSLSELEARPSRQALFRDPLDPLDP